MEYTRVLDNILNSKSINSSIHCNVKQTKNIIGFAQCRFAILCNKTSSDGDNTCGFGVFLSGSKSKIIYTTHADPVSMGTAYGIIIHTRVYHVSAQQESAASSPFGSVRFPTRGPHPPTVFTTADVFSADRPSRTSRHLQICRSSWVRTLSEYLIRQRDNIEWLLRALGYYTTYSVEI